MTLCFDMDLAHQWAGGIDEHQIARFGGIRHGFWDPMGGENDGAIIGALIKLMHKDCPLHTQAVDHKFIVHNFMAHINRCTPFLESQLNDFDGTVYARTKSARGGKVKFKLGF